MSEVLVVDDDADIRAVLRMALEDEGYRVREAADGAGALALLQAAAQPLVVLVDLVLRDTDDGPALLRAIQAEPRLRRHIYMAVTGWQVSTLTPDVRELVAAVCREVVLKPFDLEALLDAVRRAAEQLAIR
jgi:CheY-like chemotaxis protein